MQDPQPLVGGRSNLVWRAGALVIKLYRPERANLMFANDPAREALALRWLAETEMAPPLREAGTFEGRSWLLYDHIEGSAWQQGSSEVAQLLGWLHRLPAPKGLPTGRNGSADLLAQTQSILRLCASDSALRDLQPSVAVAPTSQVCVIHGDPVPGNVMVHKGGLTLIDWQCPQIGDPAEDLALFLSPAMQRFYRGQALSAEEEQQFLAAYPDRAVVARYLTLRPWFHWRMAAYCLWRGDKTEAALEIQSLRSLSASSA